MPMGAGGQGVPMQQGMPMHQGMPMQQGMPMRGYGYWGNRFMRPRGFGSETKPFFLTSEFVVSLLASIAIAITAASSTAFGAWRAWILIAAIVCAYSISRGIAKCGTQSRADDPRENLELSWRRDHNHGDQAQHGTTARYEAPQHGSPTV